MAQVPRMKDRMSVTKDRPSTQALTISGILIGGGLGGLFYSILFHHIFQSSLMLSNRFFPNTWINMQYNLYWEGILLAITLVSVLLGVTLLWAVARRKDLPLLKDTFFGAILTGWGLFHLTEGLLNHHFLQIHHIVQQETAANQLFYDYLYLGSGVILMGFGAWLRAMDSEVLVRRQTRVKTAQYTPV